MFRHLLLLSIVGTTSSWGQGHRLQAFATGLRSLEQVATDAPAIATQLESSLRYVGVIRPYCGSRSTERGSAYLVADPITKKLLLRSVAHAVEAYRGMKCTYEFSSAALRIGLDDSFISKFDETRDIVEFDLSGLKQIPSTITGLAQEEGYDRLVAGVPVVAFGFPNSEVEGTPMACFGHALAVSSGGMRRTTACAEPSMSGSPLFAIRADGALVLAGTVATVADIEGLLTLHFRYEGRKLAAPLSFNRYNSLVRAGTENAIALALDGVTVGLTDQSSSGLVVAAALAPIVRAWGDAIDRALALAPIEPRQGMDELLRTTATLLEGNDVLVVDVPLLPLGETVDGAAWMVELLRAKAAVGAYSAGLKAKQKALQGFEISDAFSTKLLRTGVHSEDAARAALIFPLQLLLR